MVILLLPFSGVLISAWGDGLFSKGLPLEGVRKIGVSLSLLLL